LEIAVNDRIEGRNKISKKKKSNTANAIEHLVDSYSWRQR